MEKYLADKFLLRKSICYSKFSRVQKYGFHCVFNEKKNLLVILKRMRQIQSLILLGFHAGKCSFGKIFNGDHFLEKYGNPFSWYYFRCICSFKLQNFRSISFQHFERVEKPHFYESCRGILATIYSISFFFYFSLINHITLASSCLLKKIRFSNGFGIQIVNEFSEFFL